MYLPPVLRPLAAVGPVDPAVQRIAEAPFSVVRGVPGSYVAERLAGVIDSWERLEDCVWLRVADPRPVPLAQSFAAACRYRWSGGRDTAARGTSGARLGEEIREAPEGAVVVLELGGRMTAGVSRLVRAIRPAVTDRRVNVVVVAESRFPAFGRGPDSVAPAADLLDHRALEVLSSADDRARLARYAGRRVAVLHDVLATTRLWGQDAVAEALSDSYGLPSFLDRFTAVVLDRLTPDQRSALLVASTTGYWHPQMGTSPIAAEHLRPWLVPLEQQWGWLRPVWAPSLAKQLARPAGAREPAAGRRPAGASARPAGRAATVLPAASPAASQGRLEARLFGSFEVRVDGSPVPSWNGRRGAGVLRYLLARRLHAGTRDELLEEFWPGVEACVARNRLQVAVSGLRRAFAGVTQLNVVEYAGGGYRVNPELHVDVDVESFERGLRAGAAAERAGDREAARTAYRQAVALYRGDFAADAPFEEWTLLPRESLRLRLIDALDRLSRIELADGRVDDCIATAHRMLDLDPCREDAHRLLMRLYATQGRPYLALRQYEMCRRVLRTTVDAGPARETTSLYDAIRSAPAGEYAGLS
jgi:DNA-binding SARP family transcriptional activator